MLIIYMYISITKESVNKNILGILGSPYLQRGPHNNMNIGMESPYLQRGPHIYGDGGTIII